MIPKLLSALRSCLSETGDISFARTVSGVLVLYFLTTDAWFFHRKGVLVDNATLLAQLAVMTAFYGSNKVTTAASTIFGPKETPTP
jgi:hypothetical protein